MSMVPTITLNNGVEMPRLGFGVWQVPDAEATTAVATALEAGYRSIDTAAVYGNEEGTGKALAASGIPRADLFVTTKLWNSASETWTRDNVLREFDASLAKLGLDHVDLYLLHWPRAFRDDYLTILRTFAEIAESGRARAIGVSNFQVPHLERLLDETSVVPAVNQIELHPHLAQSGLRAFHARHGITTEAWSPLGQGKGLLEDATIAGLAAKHGRTPAQIVLRWHLQLGNVAIPKSVTPSRIRENLDVFGFELDADDLGTLAGLDSGTRLGPDPDEFDQY
ncbi:aldo/keto reductase [Streptomyces albireticuli]|uniref:Oxidoreductase n=1 Tax=Streptomyces albireticuli TaxID=1940 RepID=A0A2A2D8L1_9ACTN|nr:aldo/keto reductase [Streptomyces albireticuli]MCD9140847.1 aldo/keto reductase [Streptomyces albireticuli]MCD9161191.1 aldo/keto reductase [Streptomyces albireticuli]MCD9190751.1 aldo/keto reductase [Streptomyces albireticuli]PAU47719.1 oxidoreductase [Streptomyces albireticuli]